MKRKEKKIVKWHKKRPDEGCELTGGGKGSVGEKNGSEELIDVEFCCY